MQIYRTVDSTQLQASIEKLKREASCTQDLLDWFKHHLPALGMNHAENPDEVRVLGTIPFVSGIHGAVSDNPAMDMAVTVAIVNNTERHPHFDKLFNTHGDATSDHTNKFTINLSFAEWPFLTAELAIFPLSYQKDQLSARWLEIADNLLTTYLPRHYPGITWEGLQAMKDSGLIFSGDLTLDEPQFRAMLNNARKTSPLTEIELPSCMEPSV